MSTLALYLLLFLVVVCVLPTGAWAFGAGDIPDFAFLNDKAFRHGDIENILTEIVKAAGHSGLKSLGNVLKGGDGGLLGFATGALKAASSVAGGGKFTRDDVKKVYFGNWLRDYSQCMDIAGLSKLSADTLIMIVSVLGFMEFGYGTREFEVNADRLGVYLPVEHIDNPKGYAEKEGDARQWHQKLRTPVDPRELEFDDRTGMKNYMATENAGWDTSTAFIRRSFRASIEHARRANGQENEDLWEAYRLLGQGLHTLEDLMAHSNWIELSLRKLGHNEVFCHVGENVTVNSPQGPVPPLVTGTFGGADFLHSLIGEGMDKLSQTSMTDVTAEMEAAKNSDKEGDFAKLRELLGGFMSKSGKGDSDAKMSKAEALKAKSQAYNLDPDNIVNEEVQQQLKDLINFHDETMRDIEETLALVPGLDDLMEGLTNALNAYIYTLLAPYITPILAQVSGALSEGSSAVINSDDQYAVFDNPDASDPSHSMVSKDHFALILNEPAGKVAKVIVQHSVNAMVNAWSGRGDPDEVINEILEAFHHPFYASGNSTVQSAMANEFQKWFGGLGPQDEQRVLEGLTKQAVRDHKNKRLTEDEERQATNAPGLRYGHTCGGGAGHAHGASRPQGQQQSYGRPQTQQTYGGGNQGGNQHGSSGGGNSYGRTEQSSYGAGAAATNTYGSTQQSGYGSSGNEYGRTEQSSYGGGGGGNEYNTSSRTDSGNAYGRTEQSSYGSGGGNEYGSSRRTEESSGNAYGRTEQSSYGGGGNEYGRTEQSSYGGGGNAYGRTEQSSYGGGGTESGRTQQSSYGTSGNEYGRSEQPSYGGGGGNEYGRSEQTSGGYGGGEHHGGRRHEESSHGGGGGNEYGRSEGGGREEHHGSRRRHGDDDENERRGGDETYGVERLKVRDDGDDNDDNDHHRRRRHHNDD